MREHRSGIGARMEFAAFGAPIDTLGQVGEKLAVEFAPRKGAIEMFRVQTRDPRAKAAVDHRLSECTRVRPEERKDWRQPAACELVLPIPSNILEKEIAKRDVRESFSDGSCNRRGH